MDIIIVIQHVPGESNYGDLLTKPHKTARFRQLLAMVGGWTDGAKSRRSQQEHEAMMCWISAAGI